MGSKSHEYCQCAFWVGSAVVTPVQPLFKWHQFFHFHLITGWQRAPCWLNLHLTILEPPFMQVLLSCTPFLAISCSNLYWPMSLYPLLKTFMYFKYSHFYIHQSFSHFGLSIHFCSSILSNLLRTPVVWSSWTHFWPHLLTYLWRQLCLFQICPVMAVVFHPFWTFEWLVKSK